MGTAEMRAQQAAAIAADYGSGGGSIFDRTQRAFDKIRGLKRSTEEDATMYGGGAQESGEYQRQWQSGLRSGEGQVFQGRAGYLEGLGLAGQSRNQQLEAARLQQLAATGQVPSQAQELMSYAGQQQQQAMMAQAQAARGGNAAAAMRGAQYQAAQSNLGMSQQLAALRAQEMAQARAAYGDITGQIRGQDLGTSGLGIQMANAGAAREGNYLGALTGQIGGELDARTRLQLARMGKPPKQGMLGPLLGTAGAVIGGIYGGPAGAAAGGAAGSAVGGAVG